ncbi:MAG: ATP-binding protein [Shewanella fodinae]|nr:ATP-binding protein [Shewanella fodinae]
MLFSTLEHAQITLALAQDHEQLRICVADNGVGIPADKLQEVLKPFTASARHVTLISSNVGLGLAITHSLATAYGATYYCSLISHLDLKQRSVSRGIKHLTGRRNTI